MGVIESKDANAVSATFELPSLKPNDISIAFQRDRPTMPVSDSCEGNGYSIREHRYGKFSHFPLEPW